MGATGPLLGANDQPSAIRAEAKISGAGGQFLDKLPLGKVPHPAPEGPVSTTMSRPPTARTGLIATQTTAG